MVSFDKFGGSCGTPSKRFLSRDKVLSFFKPTKQLLLHPTRWLSLKINFYRDSRQLIAAGNVVSMLLDKSSECSFVMVSTFGGMVLSFCHFNANTPVALPASKRFCVVDFCPMISFVLGDLFSTLVDPKMLLCR